MPMNPRLLRPLARFQAPVDEWARVLNAAFGGSIIAAYDFREISGSSLSGRVGPSLSLTGVTATVDGGLFASTGSSANSASTVSLTYPHTLLFVAKSDQSGAERQYFGMSSTTTGGNPQAAWFSRQTQSLMPYNANDGQVTGYQPNNTEWYYAAASFLNNGTVRYQIRAASGNINGTATGSNGASGFNAYPNSGVWFNNTRSLNGTLRLAVSINSGFSSESDMNDLFAEFKSGPIADLFP